MNDELKDLIIANLDVVDFLDIIGYTLADLVEVLEDELEEHKSQLERATR
jgi:hypothetical protein